MGWVNHILGIDSQGSSFYMFWSGVGPVIASYLISRHALRVELKKHRERDKQ